MSEQAFQEAAKEFFDGVLRFHPVIATSLGVHIHDHALPRGTLAAHAEEHRWLREQLDRFSRMERRGLSPDSQLDCDLAVHLIRLSLFEDEKLRFWARYAGAPDTIGEGLFPLFTRDFAPYPQRLESIIGRLDAAPKYLTESRERLIEPVRLWNEIALETSQMLPGFLDLIAVTSKAQEGTADLLPQLQDGIAATKEALEGFNGWLQERVLPAANPQWALGREVFEELLKHRGLGLSGAEILHLGEQYLASFRTDRDRTAAQVKPGGSVGEANDHVRSHHPPTFEAVLKAYRESVAKARQFVVDRGLATFPPGEELLVIETPSFARHVIPFAAYVQPAKFDQRLLGFYLVTPPPEGKGGYLREHNYAAISNTCVHEGYPGHHLQLCCAATHPSYIRALASGTEFVEGWAFYCEELLKGFGYDDTPENRLIQVNDLLWRAARIVADVKLHRGEMSVEEAVALLEQETGMGHEAAVAEVKRYTYTPSYPLSYLLGKHLILQLRRDVERLLGERFDLRRFHDALLYAGSLPYPFLRRAVGQQLGIAV